jgi:hypothetical protein
MMRLPVVALSTLLLAQAGAAPEVRVQQGTDAGSGIAYALVSVEGRRGASATGGALATGGAGARLTAQCTKSAAGKLRFELLADAGDVDEVRFVPPWKPASKSDLFPPVMPKATVTMEFLGYTKVKPVKRQWTGIDGLPGEWKYATPGLGSGNMEDASYYMQYLKALPTLRLTFASGGSGAPPITLEFETAGWQQRVKAEPLCGASGL